MAGDDLIPPGKAVIGEVIAATVRNGMVDESYERVPALQDRPRKMIDMQIEHYTGIPIPRPRQCALMIRLDEAHGAVDEVHGIAQKVPPRVWVTDPAGW